MGSKFTPEEVPAGGFQIAPMIDVVFVIMLFFMVMAGAVKVENELNTTLPGSISESTSASNEFVDEITITIAENGEVALNDEPFDSPTSHEMKQLRDTLMRLKQNAGNAHTPTVVTIVSEPQAKYHRTVAVLDALAAAKIDTVTFNVSDD